MRYIYPAVITKNELGGFSAVVPDFECCATDGDTWREVIAMASEALELAIEGELSLQKPLPVPSDVEPSNADERVVYLCVEVDASEALVLARDAAIMLGVTPGRIRQLLRTNALAGEKQGRDNYVYLWSISERLAATA